MIALFTTRSSKRASASSRLAVPMRWASSGSSQKRQSAATSPSVSCLATKRPFSPRRTVSRQPGASVVTIARPIAMASMVERGTPSR